MDDLFNLLALQGYVTAGDAARLGVAPAALHALVSAGRLRRALHGVYLPPGQLTTEEELARRTKALLGQDPFAAASHQSALALHGLPCHKVPVAPIHLADARKSTRIHESVHRHVLRPGDKVLAVDSWRTLPAGLAAVQVAARYSVASGLVALDAALRLELTTPEELGDIIDSGRIRRGAVGARTAVALADGRSESPGESLLRLALQGLPYSIEPQAQIGPYRVDLLVAGCVALEFDGDRKYAGADGGEALIAEKRREDWLRQRVGMRRIFWAQLDYPAALRLTTHQEVIKFRAERAAS